MFARHCKTYKGVPSTQKFNCAYNILQYCTSYKYSCINNYNTVFITTTNVSYFIYFMYISVHDGRRSLKHLEEKNK
jgi:hypothetical protein